MTYPDNFTLKTKCFLNVKVKKYLNLFDSYFIKIVCLHKKRCNFLLKKKHNTDKYKSLVFFYQMLWDIFHDIYVYKNIYFIGNFVRFFILTFRFWEMFFIFKRKLLQDFNLKSIRQFVFICWKFEGNLAKKTKWKGLKYVLLI